MGIPAYFRWISEKYPRIMVDCVEFVDYDDSAGLERPVDAAAKNPNGIEFDNLYLDMNGIIHPCTHPEDRPAPTTEEEMFEAIFDYIDRIFSIVRPRKVLYMAIDGVAPRAKINQQRSRRFRSAQEAEEKRRAAEELKEEWSKLGLVVSKQSSDGDGAASFDSNVITPGTPFMARLAVALRAYVQARVAKDAAWKDIAVIFSDASVPGEGEHKIAEYIRMERAQEGYNPNLRHVMYGLDADLIMLALATHEVHFTILREEVFPKRGRRNSEPQNPDATQRAPPTQIDSVLAAEAKRAGYSTRAELGGKKPFHFLHVNVLREYLDYEFKSDIENELAAAKKGSDICYDLERVLDDFVFMCFFVGNDFLPHLPTLDIREGAIDYLIELYKTELPHTGYLTSAQGAVDFTRVRKLLQCVGRKEDEVFKERSAKEKQSAERAAREKQQKLEAKNAQAKDSVSLAQVGGPVKRKASEKDKGYQNAVFNMQTVALGRKEKKQRTGLVDDAKSGGAKTANAALTKTDPKESETKLTATVLKSAAEFKEALNERMREKNELEPFDNVKLGEEGWKDRYYRQKFAWGSGNDSEKLMLLQKYVEGLQWVMKYYYVGCISWGWYYPYHYAPFASDLVECDMNSSDMSFELGQPFAPFTQLQAVMPASSGKLVLPSCYSELMTNPESPIIDYYPEDFELDLNGKRFAWQGVALLPFIDESRLNAALAPLQDRLTEEEIKRNSFGDSYVLIHKESALASARSKRESTDVSDRENIPAAAADGQLFGKASYPLSQYGGLGGPVFTVSFQLPEYKPHSSKLLPTASIPQPELNDATRADSKRTGWKQAKFGPLGRAAKDLVMDRSRRLGAAGLRSGNQARSRGTTAGLYRTGYLPDAPVINRPTIGASQAAGASNMFGGLGTQQPGWMRAPRGYGGHSAGQTQLTSQQPNRGYYPSQPQGGSQPPASVQGSYGMHTDAYREPSKFGGYYGAGQGQGQGQGQGSFSWNASGGRGHFQTGWSDPHRQGQAAQAGWQTRSNGVGQGGWDNSAGNNAYGASGGADDKPGHSYYSGYDSQVRSGTGWQGWAGGGQGSGQGSGQGGGLAGPTAGSLRMRQSGGRGRGAESRSGQEQYGSYSGAWNGGR